MNCVENEARKVGWELRCYPSTIVKASVGGFFGGGSGGIGSVAHGNLRDFNTVLALEVATASYPAAPAPRSNPRTPDAPYRPAQSAALVQVSCSISNVWALQKVCARPSLPTAPPSSAIPPAHSAAAPKLRSLLARGTRLLQTPPSTNPRLH